jgi:hypothetical protein
MAIFLSAAGWHFFSLLLRLSQIGAALLNAAHLPI